MSDEISDIEKYLKDTSAPCWYIKEGCTDYNEGRKDIIDPSEVRPYPGCKKICLQFLQMNFLINASGMKDTERYRKELCPSPIDVASFKRLSEIKDSINKYVEEQNNLFISSPIGFNGKTNWSIRIMYKYFDLMWKYSFWKKLGYFISVPEFVDSLQDFNYRQTNEFKEISDNIKKLDLIIWDDITAVPLNQQIQNTLSTYIKRRFEEGKCNIFNGREITNPEEVLGSRIVEYLNRCEHVRILGKNPMEKNTKK